MGSLGKCMPSLHEALVPIAALCKQAGRDAHICKVALDRQTGRQAGGQAGTEGPRTRYIIIIVSSCAHETLSAALPAEANQVLHH